MNLSLPFTSKDLPDGKRLFRRKHGYTHVLTVGTSSKEIVVPYSHAKVNQAEIVWAPEGLICNFKVLDTASGTYSGVADYLLDQFGHSVNVPKDFFTDTSQYEADMYVGMRIVVEFNNTSAIEKTIGINIVFHETKI